MYKKISHTERSLADWIQQRGQTPFIYRIESTEVNGMTEYLKPGKIIGT